VKPKANGGTDAPDNLVSICRDCHDQETKEAKGQGQGYKPRLKFDDNGFPKWPI